MGVAYDQSNSTSFPIKEVNPERCIEKLKSVGEIKSYAKDAVVSAPGASGSRCFVVLEGSVQAQHHTVSGMENAYIAHGPGYAMLEAQCFCEWTETAYFRAMEPSMLLMLERRKLMEALKGDHELALFFIGTLSEKFRWYIDHARNLSAHSAMWRLCEQILSFADQYGKPHDGNILIDRKYSQQTLANMLHLNRITVVRYIKELKDMKLIEYVNGYLCVRDMAALSNYRDSAAER
jgi:CRP/FNR family transcriptional regulator